MELRAAMNVRDALTVILSVSALAAGLLTWL